MRGPRWWALDAGRPSGGGELGPGKEAREQAGLLALAGRAGRRRRGLRSVGRRGENWAGVERDWAARGLIWAGIWD